MKIRKKYISPQTTAVELPQIMSMPDALSVDKGGGRNDDDAWAKEYDFDVWDLEDKTDGQYDVWEE